MEKTRTYAIHPAAFKNQPVAAPHQSFLPIGSEAPIVKKSSFPPGEAKGEVAGAGSPNGLTEGVSCVFLQYSHIYVAHPLSLASLSSSLREGAKAAAPLGSPSWRPLQGAGKTIGLQQPTKYTPSASLCSAAPSEREPRRLRRLRVACQATPTERVQTDFCVVLNRAGQETNVWVQVRCVIVRRHCRPM